MIVVAGLGFGLSGCSLKQMLVPDTPPPATYDLIVSPTGTTMRKAYRHQGPQLIVAEPTAVRALANDRIMIRPQEDNITYFPKSVWADRLPLLIQARLIEGLNGAHYFQAVGSGRERLKADTHLATVIEAFHIEMRHGQPVAIVRLVASLIDAGTGRAYASRTFSYEAVSDADRVEQAIPAFNEALRHILDRLVPWSVRSARNLK